MKKFLRGLVLFILVPALFLATFSLLILIPTRNIFSEDMIENVIKNIDVEKMMADDPKVKEEVEVMFEPIYTETRKYGIDDEVINKIINSNEVKGFIADVTSNLTKYVLTGENEKIINTEDITELVETAIDDINESGIYEIKTEDKDKILDAVETAVDDNQDLVPDTSVIEKSIPQEDKQVLDVVRFIFSDTLMYYLLGALGISIVGIILVKLTKYKFVKWITIPVLIASFLTTASSVLLLIGESLISEDFVFVTDLIVRSIRYSTILSGSILGIMIVILISYAVINKHSEKTKALDNKNEESKSN